MHRLCCDTFVHNYPVIVHIHLHLFKKTQKLIIIVYKIKPSGIFQLLNLNKTSNKVKQKRHLTISQLTRGNSTEFKLTSYSWQCLKVKVISGAQTAKRAKFFAVPIFIKFKLTVHWLNIWARQDYSDLIQMEILELSQLPSQLRYR